MRSKLNIIIDQEFRDLIPPLSADERAQLEQNLIDDGCRDPLVVWPLPEYEVETENGIVTLRFCDAEIVSDWDEKKGSTSFRCWPVGDGYEDVYEDGWPTVLVDGHNRHDICDQRGIEFDTIEHEFEGRDDAKLWIVQNQLGRRNLTDFVRTELSLIAKPIIEARARANQIAGGSEKVPLKSAEPVETNIEIAKIAGVGKDTVRKVEKIKESAAPELLAAVRSGGASINAASVIAAAPEDQQREIVARVAAGEETFAQAAKEIHNHRAQGTGENEWYTPAEYIELARKVLDGIDLDPASSAIAQQTVKSERYFTQEDDGLSREWAGKVWLNPPYTQPAIQQFAEKICEEYESGRVIEAVMLTHNYTDTRWFHHAAKSASAICFTRGRIGFLSPEGKRAAPTQGQAFFYFGSRPGVFAGVFAEVGLVVFSR